MTRKQKRHDRIVHNIGICANPTRAQAIRLLPIATWRAATTIVPSASILQAAVCLGVIASAAWWMPALLGTH